MQRSPRTCCSLCGSEKFSAKMTVHRGGEDYSIVACDACGHVFVADPPDDTANHVDINAIDWAFRARHSQIRRLILAHVRPGGKILEIGCGRGEVGYLLRNDPFEYRGYEPARGLSDFGIREGIPIVQEIYRGGETADAVIIDNVLEHVAEPRAIVRTARQSLKPGGIIIAITPNIHDIRAVLPSWRSRHLWVPPDHINFFSARDIDAMFATAGLRAHRFKFSPLSLSDWKFFPRAAAETVGLSIFGHNVYAKA